MAGKIQAQLWDVALDQYGYVTSRDARALDINVVELGKLAHRGQLEKVGHGVYRFPRYPVTQLDPYMLATLWAGGHGVLSHETILDLYELGDVNPAKIHMTIPRGHRLRRRGGELYVIHSADLDADQIGWFEGIPAVTPSTAIEQTIHVTPSHLARQAVHKAHDRGLIDTEARDRFLHQLEAAT
ncbi:type IV toxin-antitoxin system AbiEi family antitoxin domain-containing protein [Phytoactinopolyspora halotolerans]|uniref:AbiEi antitoxin N-terminal domain-containing protein n=1 Tax=Phytoactinopolyspora halotolerans TaxID=1981512 RepID=A0A6L9S2H2_9ACTN|nr:type IV toxin-antitoxin system AbiEi family antitoxin domain-containing protein [Phytoactinopolyspora halotolerans]NED98627.1 hypothetical protein [Phytoactinopolyspora halotolerans]